MVYVQSRICPREWDAQKSLEYRDTNGSPNLGQTTKLYNNQQKNRTCKNFGLCCPGGPSEIKTMWKEELVRRSC